MARTDDAAGVSCVLLPGRHRGNSFYLSVIQAGSAVSRNRPELPQGSRFFERHNLPLRTRPLSPVAGCVADSRHSEVDKIRTPHFLVQYSLRVRRRGLSYANVISRVNAQTRHKANPSKSMIVGLAAGPGPAPAGPRCAAP